MLQANLRLSTELSTWQQQLQAWALTGALAQACSSRASIRCLSCGVTRIENGTSSGRRSER